MSPLGVAPCPPPRLEGTIALADGRRLGFAEYGDPTGPLVLWFHGTPGARRQVPLIGRRAAEELGLRLVCLERPGVGDSTDHTYAHMRDWAPDVAQVADRLGHERFMVVGLSGGGPYALACAHELPSRVVAAGLLGPVVPTTGDEEEVHGLLAAARRYNAVLPLLRVPLARKHGLQGSHGKIADELCSLQADASPSRAGPVHLRRFDRHWKNARQHLGGGLDQVDA